MFDPLVGAENEWDDSFRKVIPFIFLFNYARPLLFNYARHDLEIALQCLYHLAAVLAGFNCVSD